MQQNTIRWMTEAAISKSAKDRTLKKISVNLILLSIKKATKFCHYGQIKCQTKILWPSVDHRYYWWITLTVFLEKLLLSGQLLLDTLGLMGTFSVVSECFLQIYSFFPVILCMLPSFTWYIRYYFRYMFTRNTKGS